jgi:multicomponent Na+:H+ antiporter subunit D
MNPATLLLEHSPALAIAVPLIAAFAAPLTERIGRRARNVWVVASLAFTELLVILLSQDIFAGNAHVYTLGASDPGLTSPVGFPLRIILVADALSAMFMLAGISIALLAVIYSCRFMKEDKSLSKFYTLVLILSAAMMGLCLTGDFFTLFVFLEVSSIAAAGIIAYYRSGESVEAAFKYIVISSVGALLVLFGIGMLYGKYHLLNMAAIAGQMAGGYSVIDTAALVLLFTAFAMKCGAVPVHMWVSDSYGEAPAPISAILVVASQAGLYALFRISLTVFGAVSPVSMTGWIMVILGMLSMFIGVTMAIMQKDIKRLMAYHAISQTGYMLLGVGVGLAVLGNAASMDAFGTMAVEGGLFHVINHAMYKGLLFLTAGAIIYRTGTKDLNRMGGLAHSMPLTTVLFMIGALSIAGLPPFNGFASKLMIYESVFMFSPLLSVVGMLVSMLTLASFIKVFHSAFMGPKLHEYAGVREVPVPMLVPMVILAVMIVLFGIVPDIVVEGIIAPAANSLIDQVGYISGVL